MHYTEEQLIQGCLAKDRKWQRQLFEIHKKKMYTLVFRILNDPDHAQDSLQEGFIEVFRDLAQFQQRSSLQTWIKAIMIRKALKKLKLENRHKLLDAQTNCHQLIVWPDQLSGEALDQAIRSLAPGYRAVFTLVEVEGYTHKETAEMLGISEGTSKSQLFHAKRLLQAKLKGLYP